MAEEKKKPTSEEIEAKRKASLEVLKTKLGALAYSQITQGQSKPGETLHDWGYSTFLKYLNNKDITGFAGQSLAASEFEGAKSGKRPYSGTMNSQDLIDRASSAIVESLNAVYVGDIAEMLGIKFKDKYKNKIVGDLKAKDASKEDKELYALIHNTYIDSAIMKKYTVEAVSDQASRSKSGLEERLTK